MSDCCLERGKLSALECFVVFTIQVMLLVVLDPKIIRASELIGASAFFLSCTALCNVAPKVKALVQHPQSSSPPLSQIHRLWLCCPSLMYVEYTTLGSPCQSRASATWIGKNFADAALEWLWRASRLVFLGLWIWFVGFLIANGAPGWFWGRYLLGMAPTLYAIWHTRQRLVARRSKSPSAL